MTETPDEQTGKAEKTDDAGTDAEAGEHGTEVPELNEEAQRLADERQAAGQEGTLPEDQESQA